MLFTASYILYTLFVLALIVHLLMSGGRPTKTLAWLIIIALIPVGGIILYATLGLNRRKHKLGWRSRFLHPLLKPPAFRRLHCKRPKPHRP
ncbi:MAG: hypothetical protein GVY26_14870 [Bacteroidetes bacterium]|jgi:cardiolipin synthase|nr:hypothetical protein [Bacteroidota bacterium]